MGGWLRASEVSHWSTMTCLCTPQDGPRYALPPGVGALLLRLLPSTKRSPYATADLILASTFASGLSPLQQWEEFLSCCQPLGWMQGLLFRHPDGTSWTSEYFRTHHLYPILHLQQLGGDASLCPYDDSPGNSISVKFYSFHTYCRGGRSSSSQKREFNVQVAMHAETVEHGCWRTKGSPTGDMPTHYHEWTLEDRIYITLLCMWPPFSISLPQL